MNTVTYNRCFWNYKNQKEQMNILESEKVKANFEYLLNDQSLRMGVNLVIY